MGARSKARKRALDVLYESAQRDADPMATLRERLAQSDPPVPEYAAELVEGVVAHQERIDELSHKYTGRPYPWYGGRDQVRVVITIDAEKVSSVGV